MSGDYTRNSFSPARGFSGVHKQQGRVNLDAEFNELEQIIDRRGRAQMLDILGPHPGRVIVPLVTPTGFEIQVSGSSLTIGVGRAYVDGILVEAFGDLSIAEATEFDPALGNIVGPGTLAGTGTIFYEQQPFAAGSQPSLSTDDRTTDLVYLDVWHREVTVFEDPSLREPALNGPDTATRVQTVWQVKVLPHEGGTDCATPGAGWDALVAPSTGRLTVTTASTSVAPGACIIETSGGYSGPENRLYRVEIHQDGVGTGAGAATFKWSRDNGSVMASVVQIATGLSSVITVDTTGPDLWRRFAVDDHIELLDDTVEFTMRETGHGGTMLVVVAVNHQLGQITVATDLSVFPFDPARHPRIRRWDVLDALELLTRPADGTILLEEGISVTFDGDATSTLHAGDYWVFAARTVDGSVEALTHAPPRGILHHFARLARVTSGVVSDCRIFWPGEGCCTVVVAVGDSIQEAIESLRPRGGCVCLKMGEHVIDAPLRIDFDNVTLHAEAPQATILLRKHAAPVLAVDPSYGPAGPGPGSVVRHLTIRGIDFETEVKSGNPLVRLERVHDAAIIDCGLHGHGNEIGALILVCDDVAIEGCTMTNCRTGVEGAASSHVRVVRNWVKGGTNADEPGIHFFRGADGITIEGNTIEDHAIGIRLAGVTSTAEGMVSRIAGNAIERKTHAAPAEADRNAVRSAIEVADAVVEVSGNTMNLPQPNSGGINVVGGDALVAWNQVRSITEESIQFPVGVLITAPDLDKKPVTLAMVRENNFAGHQRAVVVTGERIRATVTANRIVSPVGESSEGDPALKAAITLLGIEQGLILDNHVSGAVCGVHAQDSNEVAIRGNLLQCGGASAVFGILIRSVPEVILAANRVLTDASGHGTHGVTIKRAGLVRIHGCVVRTTGAAELVHASGYALRVEFGKASDAHADIGDNEFEHVAASVVRVTSVPAERGGSGEVLFDGNRCRTQARDIRVHAVHLQGEAVLANNNRIETPHREYPCLMIESMRYMTIGNILGGTLAPPGPPGLNLENVP